jgi:hypothetical protein
MIVNSETVISGCYKLRLIHYVLCGNDVMKWANPEIQRLTRV